MKKNSKKSARWCTLHITRHMPSIPITYFHQGALGTPLCPTPPILPPTQLPLLRHPTTINMVECLFHQLCHILQLIISHLQDLLFLLIHLSTTPLDDYRNGRLSYNKIQNNRLLVNLWEKHDKNSVLWMNKNVKDLLITDQVSQK